MVEQAFLLRAMNCLKVDGYKIGGIISRECRKQGVRVGFEILDYATRKKGWLAHTKQPTNPRVGKYPVNLKNLNTIGAESILKALTDADLIVIDEICPMESHSSKLKRGSSEGNQKQ